VTGGRPLSFHDLSVGEALAHAPKERENSGGGKFPSQISRRKDQAGSLGTEEKISPPLEFQFVLFFHMIYELTNPYKEPIKESNDRIRS
jgi:hypothetical protein